MLPTLLDHLDLTPPPGVAGTSLLALLDQQSPPRRPMFSLALPRPKRVRHLRAEVQRRGQVASVRFFPHKLIAYPVEGGLLYELFDLRQDPAERRDLSSQQPDRVRTYGAELAAWYGDAKVLEAPPQMLSPHSEEVLRSLGYVE